MRARSRELSSADSVRDTYRAAIQRKGPQPAVPGGGHASREDNAIGALAAHRTVLGIYDAPPKRTPELAQRLDAPDAGPVKVRVNPCQVLAPRGKPGSRKSSAGQPTLAALPLFWNADVLSTAVADALDDDQK